MVKAVSQTYIFVLPEDSHVTATNVRCTTRAEHEGVHFYLVNVHQHRIRNVSGTQSDDFTSLYSCCV